MIFTSLKMIFNWWTNVLRYNWAWRDTVLQQVVLPPHSSRVLRSTYCLCRVLRILCVCLNLPKTYHLPKTYIQETPCALQWTGVPHTGCFLDRLPIYYDPDQDNAVTEDKWTITRGSENIIGWSGSYWTHDRSVLLRHKRQPFSISIHAMPTHF